MGRRTPFSKENVDPKQRSDGHITTILPPPHVHFVLLLLLFVFLAFINSFHRLLARLMCLGLYWEKRILLPWLDGWVLCC